MNPEERQTFNSQICEHRNDSHSSGLHNKNGNHEDSHFPRASEEDIYAYLENCYTAKKLQF
jgi:hypothetical protein